MTDGVSANVYFEKNKNRSGAVEYPFYVHQSAVANGPFTVDPHWHYHAEILYFYAGQANLQLGGHRLPARAGDLVLISPCDIHALQIDTGGPAGHFVIGCDPELLQLAPEVYFRIKYVLPQMAAMSNARPAPVLIRSACGPDVENLVREIAGEYQRQEMGFELVVTAGIFRLVTGLFRDLERDGLMTATRIGLSEVRLQALKNALAYIDAHYREDISAAAIARASLLSYSHFAWLFKSVMHMPVTRYLNHYRIRRSEQLLQDPAASITAVALETGFGSLSYFSEQFRKQKGLTPRQYRRQVSGRRPD